jgi:hypothetical protein
MFRYRKISNYLTELCNEIINADLEKVATTESNSLIEKIALAEYINRPNGMERETWKKFITNQGSTIINLVEFIKEKEPTWDKNQIEKEIGYCIEPLGFFNKNTFYGERVNLTKKGDDVKKGFWGWLYCFNLSIQKYGEIRALLLGLVPAAAIGFFFRQIFDLVAFLLRSIPWEKAF